MAARDQWDDIPAALSSLAIDGPVDLLSRAALTDSLADRARRDDVPIARLYERALADLRILLPLAGRDGGVRTANIQRLAARALLPAHHDPSGLHIAPRSVIHSNGFLSAALERFRAEPRGPAGRPLLGRMDQRRDA